MKKIRLEKIERQVTDIKKLLSSSNGFDSKLKASFLDESIDEDFANKTLQIINETSQLLENKKNQRRELLERLKSEEAKYNNINNIITKLNQSKEIIKKESSYDHNKEIINTNKTDRTDKIEKSIVRDKSNSKEIIKNMNINNSKNTEDNFELETKENIKAVSKAIDVNISKIKIPNKNKQTKKETSNDNNTKKEKITKKCLDEIINRIRNQSKSNCYNFNLSDSGKTPILCSNQTKNIDTSSSLFNLTNINNITSISKKTESTDLKSSNNNLNNLLNSQNTQLNNSNLLLNTSQHSDKSNNESISISNIRVKNKFSLFNNSTNKEEDYSSEERNYLLFLNVMNHSSFNIFDYLTNEETNDMRLINKRVNELVECYSLFKESIKNMLDALSNSLISFHNNTNTNKTETAVQNSNKGIISNCKDLVKKAKMKEHLEKFNLNKMKL